MNIFSTKTFLYSLCLVFVFLLCNCKKNIHNFPKGNLVGGREIIFNKNNIILDAKKREVSVKTGKSNEGMEIQGVRIIIDNDTTYFRNEQIPHENRHGDRKELIQYFYYFRDTVYGDWYRVIHEGQKIHVKLNENNSGKSRKLIVCIEDGNDYGGVSVTQEARKK
ncbi:MAG: hypothetical protein LBU57_06815 [Dysgonamonadaceae bacterium]|jgi:hypothetical protein|nr:hypothetical protein [Dysgonamonadaceae bacterium]